MTVFTAIIGPYEELKEPAVITPGWRYVCFTDQTFESKAWNVIRIPRPQWPILLARDIKIQWFRYVHDDLSIWVDGSFTINVNLDQWMLKHFMKPFTVIGHPIRNCVYEEADACIKNGRGDSAEAIMAQKNRYAKMGIKAHGGMIQSGILMRQDTPAVRQFCTDWYEELLNGSTRDQIAWAAIPKEQGLIHTIQWDYRTGREFIFRTHKHRR